MKRVLLAAVLCGTGAFADETQTEVRFAEPVRIEAGGKLVGTDRYYPSPVLYDIDGDRHRDLIVADLFGRVTVAHGTGNGDYAAETPLLGKDGKPLKFENW